MHVGTDDRDQFCLTVQKKRFIEKNNFPVKIHIQSNLTVTGREILCQNKQGVGLHCVKHIENQKGMNINVG